MSFFYDRCLDCDECLICCCQFDVGLIYVDIVEVKCVVGIVVFFIVCVVVVVVMLGVL